jgi:glycosyltransferase involved in cell wall biosynthesis
MVKPSVTVILSHRNSARTIGQCIQGILNQDYPRELVRLIVVDANSNDGSIEIERRMLGDRMTLIVPPGCSEAGGQIMASKLVESEVIMFTNSDIYVPQYWISRHVEWLERGYDIVGGKVFWAGDKYAFTWNMVTRKKYETIQQGGTGLGFSNCSVKTEFFWKVGGLKDMIGHQDTEFAFRSLRDGGKLFLDFTIEVTHDHPFKSIRDSFMRSRGYARNHLLVMRLIFGRKYFLFLLLELVKDLKYLMMFSAVSLLAETIALNGVKAWKAYRDKGLKCGFRMNLLEFLFIRWMGWFLGHVVGIPQGLLARNITVDSIANLHTRRQHFP